MQSLLSGLPTMCHRLTPSAIRARRAEFSRCARRVAGRLYRGADDVLFRSELPLISTGKIDKNEICAALDAEEYRLPDLRG